MTGTPNLDDWHLMTLRQAEAGFLSRRAVAIALYLCDGSDPSYRSARIIQELVAAGCLTAPRRSARWLPDKPFPGWWRRRLWRPADLTEAGRVVLESAVPSPRHTLGQPDPALWREGRDSNGTPFYRWSWVQMRWVR